MTSSSREPVATHLQLSVQSHGTTVVLSATGEADVVTAPDLEETARRALEDAPPVLVVDLTGVTFLSSAGLTALVRTQELARDTEVRIVAASPAVRRPLELMALDQVLALYPSLDQALAESAIG